MTPKSKLSRLQREHYPRQRRLGEQNGLSKLKAKQVLAIRRDGRTQEAIAAAFGVDQCTVSEIKRRKTWAG